MDDTGAILLVEDDSDIRDSLTEILREEGYDVHAAEHGKRGLETLRAMPRPCIILLDMMMPVMDGDAFLAELRREPRFEAVPVIALTATPGPARRDVSAWLRKPYKLGELLSVVHDHCAPRDAANDA